MILFQQQSVSRLAVLEFGNRTKTQLRRGCSSGTAWKRSQCSSRTEHTDWFAFHFEQTYELKIGLIISGSRSTGSCWSRTEPDKHFQIRAETKAPASSSRGWKRHSTTCLPGWTDTTLKTQQGGHRLVCFFSSWGPNRAMQKCKNRTW